MTQINWTTIRDKIENDIVKGDLKPGDQLPTEPQLVQKYSAGRHSVRKAVEALAKAGKLSVRQGLGIFVEATPRLTYEIGKRTRLRSNLIPQGCEVSEQSLSADMITATEVVRQKLKLGPDEKVVVSQRITLADGLPIAFGSTFLSAARFPDFAKRRDVLGSTTSVYKTYGIEDYVRDYTSIHARQAKAEEAKILRQHPDVPVIVVHAVDTELDGTPLSYIEGIWAAGRVQFTMGGKDA
ncbi:phosphonate metabolism transcriptional regulator PhnF [Rhizobium laguerreae]|uniref:phosphonate metabolism transcriptional regulator PhnF n=1 Tax=Rhizobium laguerreae TaxID=1076926 RepID=UPI00103B3401|nr:phosphonate metabolism transcriptional regulator PhnF [Rhizobium laguerreae]TBX99072.1 phosphonate metabolism transcriptional regulator PhnF [Rhizobium laguerreae]